MSDALTVYEIPAFNMPGLVGKIEKLSKKSMKILGKPIALNVLGEVRIPRTIARMDGKSIPVLNADGEQVFDVRYRVTIEAETPKIAGWTFVATIDHSPENGNIIRVNPNTNFTPDHKYRTIDRRCDHCGKIRNRRDTFLLCSDTTGEVKQIGRQCIRDFIGYPVEQVVAMAEIVSSAVPSDSDGEGDWMGGMRDHRYIFVQTYLAHVSAVMRAYGWVSRGQADIVDKQPTADVAHFNMFPPPRTKREDLKELTAQDFEAAEAAIEWGQQLTGKTDYEYNLSIVSKETMVERRSTGLLASLVPAFMRAKEREFEIAQRKASMKLTDSKHVGAIGDRLRDVEAILYGYHPTTGGMYGPSYLYRFQTTDGHVLTWFSTTGIEGLGHAAAAARTKVRITGTVKKHGEYQDVKQTTLSRCKVVVA